MQYRNSNDSGNVNTFVGCFADCRPAQYCSGSMKIKLRSLRVSFTGIMFMV